MILYKGGESKVMSALLSYTIENRNGVTQRAWASRLPDREVSTAMRVEIDTRGK